MNPKAASCTSLTAVLYNRSLGTLPLSILPATGLTGPFHGSVKSYRQGSRGREESRSWCKYCDGSCGGRVGPEDQPNQGPWDLGVSGV